MTELRDSITPVMVDELNSNRSMLQETEEQVAQLCDDLNGSSSTIQSLQNEVINLKEQNERLQTALEYNNKQNRILRKKNGVLMDTYSQKINELNEEKDALYDELDAIKNGILFNLTNDNDEKELDNGKLNEDMSINKAPFHDTCNNFLRTLTSDELTGSFFSCRKILNSQSMQSDVSDDYQEQSEQSQSDDYPQNICLSPMDNIDEENEEHYQDQPIPISPMNDINQEEVNKDDGDDDVNLLDVFDEDELLEMQKIFEDIARSPITPRDLLYKYGHHKTESSVSQIQRNSVTANSVRKKVNSFCFPSCEDPLCDSEEKRVFDNTSFVPEPEEEGIYEQRAKKLDNDNLLKQLDRMRQEDEDEDFFSDTYDEDERKEMEDLLKQCTELMSHSKKDKHKKFYSHSRWISHTLRMLLYTPYKI